MIRPLITRLGVKSFQKPLQTLFRTPLVRSKPLLSSPFLFSPLVRPLTTQNVATASGAVARQSNWPKILGQIGIIGGTIVGLNLFFNRETREGGIPPSEQAYLNETFKYVGAGLGITAIAAAGLFRTGFAFRFMSMNPLMALLVGLGASIGTMMGTLYTDPANTVQKHAFWAAFSVSQGLFLAPFYFYNPAILARAGLYTLGTIGSLSYIAATAKTDQYLYLGGPLLAGLAVVILSGLAPLVLPVTAVRTLALTDTISIYGGIAIFGGYVLYDTQKIMQRARMGYRDAVAESLSLELDAINLFIRFVIMLSGGQRRK